MHYMLPFCDQNQDSFDAHNPHWSFNSPIPRFAHIGLFVVNLIIHVSITSINWLHRPFHCGHKLIVKPGIYRWQLVLTPDILHNGEIFIVQNAMDLPPERTEEILMVFSIFYRMHCWWWCGDTNTHNSVHHVPPPPPPPHLFLFLLLKRCNLHCAKRFRLYSTVKPGDEPV